MAATGRQGWGSIWMRAHSDTSPTLKTESMPAFNTASSARDLGSQIHTVLPLAKP